MEDPDQFEQDYKISNMIYMMDPEEWDRFKALKVLADQSKELDAELQSEIHQLEIFYEQLYDEIYYLREDIVAGKTEPKDMLVNQFDEISRRYKGDNQYDKL